MALSSKRPGALLIRVPRNKENRNRGKYNWENPPVTNLQNPSSLFTLTRPSLTLILVYKDFLVDYHRAEEDGNKKRKLVITRTTQEQQDILLFALSGVLFAGLNNAVAYQKCYNTLPRGEVYWKIRPLRQFVNSSQLKAVYCHSFFQSGSVLEITRQTE